MIGVPLRVNLFERGDDGVPSATFVTDISARLDRYEHTIDHHIGFETMTCSFPATFDDAADILETWLMRHVEVAGPGGTACWEGFLETIEAQFGPVTRSVSLRAMTNRLRVRYQTVLGSQGVRPVGGVTFFEDADSIAIYGKKDLALALGDTSDGTEVDDYATVELRKRSNPLSGPSAAAQTGDAGEIRVTLHFAGWYTTLDWVLMSNTSTTKTTTTTQIGTLLAAFQAVNNFIDDYTLNIVASGVTATEFADLDTTYRAKIEALMARGNGTEPYAWGIYEDRIFYAREWAGADPETITYRQSLAGSHLMNTAGGIVDPWDIRPDAMHETVELLDVSPLATQQDATGRMYIARVTCSVADDISVRLEPEASSDLAAILITKYQ